MVNPNRLYQRIYNILTKHSAKKLQVITNPKTAQPHTILTKNKASLGKKIIIINLNTVHYKFIRNIFFFQIKIS